jgi:LPS-assembly lipoprotein
MSSFNRRSLLLMPLALMACGFTPAYGPNGPAAGLQGSVSVASPDDKNSFDLVERLEERLGRPKVVAYDMTYTIKTNAVGVGITPDNAITRYNLNGSIDWALVSRTTGQRVTGGTVHSFTSYSATGSTVAGLAAQEDAARRLMRLLADQIVSRMLASSGIWAK